MSISMLSFSVIPIIVAAGDGTRMQETPPKKNPQKTNMPKAFLPLHGKAILAHTLSALMQYEIFQQCVIVINPNHIDFMTKLLDDFPDMKQKNKIHLCDGGKRRQDSVQAGLDYIAQNINPPPDYVLIHDAARPFVTLDLLERLMAEAQNHHNTAIIPGLPLRDTIKQTHDDGTVTTLPRKQLRSIQTPQLFPFQLLHQLHKKFKMQNFTDDAGLFEANGEKIIIIDGAFDNIKITYPQDLE